MRHLIDNPIDILDYEYIMIAVNRAVDAENTKAYPNTEEMLPHLEQTLKLMDINFDTFYQQEHRQDYPAISYKLHP
jgi:hypothetical protein